MEHTIESTERDIAWLDRLIDAERARGVTSAGPPVPPVPPAAEAVGVAGPAHVGTMAAQLRDNTGLEEGDAR
jgi:hypothetical protein